MAGYTSGVAPQRTRVVADEKGTHSFTHACSRCHLPHRQLRRHHSIGNGPWSGQWRRPIANQHRWLATLLAIEASTIAGSVLLPIASRRATTSSPDVERSSRGGVISQITIMGLENSAKSNCVSARGAWRALCHSRSRSSRPSRFDTCGRVVNATSQPLSSSAEVALVDMTSPRMRGRYARSGKLGHQLRASHCPVRRSQRRRSRGLTSCSRHSNRTR